MAIRWSPLVADFFDVVGHGKVQADHLGVGLGFGALLRREVNLQSIVLDRPVLRMRVDAIGNLNLAKQTPPRSSSSMKLTVRHASIHDGIMNFNDQRIPLSAELEGFRA